MRGVMSAKQRKVREYDARLAKDRSLGDAMFCDRVYNGYVTPSISEGAKVILERWKAGEISADDAAQFIQAEKEYCARQKAEKRKAERINRSDCPVGVSPLVWDFYVQRRAVK